MSFRFGAIAGCLGLCVSSAAMGADVSAAGDDAAREIAAIKAKIQELETREQASQARQHVAEQTLDEKSTDEQLAVDANRQDHFLTAEGFTAGYNDNRFAIQSGDGNFLFRPWVHLQFRDVTLDRVDLGGIKNHPKDEWDNGFEVRQLRFGFDGNLFSPDLTYFFNWATQRTSGNANVTNAGTKVGTVSNSLGGVLVLQQAWARYRVPTTPFYIKAGQLKDPLLHEQIVDTRYQQVAERSVSADIFANGDDYTEAVTFSYDPGPSAVIRAEAGVNHGMRSANTNFLDYPNNGAYNAFNYGVVGRAEYRVMGRWADYLQVGAVGTKEPLLIFGTGADYSERGHSGQLVAVADAMYADPSGLSIYGEFIDRYTTHNFGYYIQSPTGANITAGDPIVAGKPTNEYAVMGQAGYIIDKHWEPFGRYELIHLQGLPTGSRKWLQVVTTGVNYYFHGHRLKLTGEVIYLPEGLPFDDTSSDVLTNSNGKTELSFVAQLQLVL